MKNWRTTIVGGIAAILVLVQGVLEKIAAGQPVDYVQVGLAIALALFGYLAKDFKVSGTGTPGTK